MRPGSIAHAAQRMILLPLFLGLVAGAVHVLTGPDHLAAIAPLAVRRRGWRSGFVWGVGHTSGVWVVACAAFATQRLLPLEAMSCWSDRLGGGALVLLGLWTLAGCARARRRGPAASGRGRHLAELRAASVLGILHGLGGSSHYLGVLPAFAFASPSACGAYLFGFGAATVTAMTTCAWGFGRACRLPRAAAVARVASGAAAVVVGLVWGLQP